MKSKNLMTWALGLAASALTVYAIVYVGGKAYKNSQK